MQAALDAPAGSALLVLADGYPVAPTSLDRRILKTARSRNLRLFVEFPSMLPDRVVGEIASVHLERLVVAGEQFGPELPPMTIMGLHDAHFRTESRRTHRYWSVARVAGVSKQPLSMACRIKSTRFCLNLPDYNAADLHVEDEPIRHGTLPAHSKLEGGLENGAQTGSCRTKIFRNLSWEPRLRAKFKATEPLPPDAAETASKTGGEWFINSRMLFDPKWTPDNDVNGDGSFGALEGINSRILCDGTQPYLPTLRNDCCNEVAMALAVRGRD